ncbi:hypothetical protein [Pantoea sp. Nvir]|uniref:hypothetical protein n=1 Tax=Pantoea sp. Nvir TaxID=2576760 RepID=UPI0035BE5B49
MGVTGCGSRLSIEQRFGLSDQDVKYVTSSNNFWAKPLDQQLFANAAISLQ